jgi:hypothetical protein
MKNYKNTIILITKILERSEASEERILVHSKRVPAAFIKVDTHFQCIPFIAFHYFQNQCSQDVEALTVPNILVPPGIGQQHPLQYNPVLLSLLATVRTTSCTVKVLKRKGNNAFKITPNTPFKIKALVISLPCH